MISKLKLFTFLSFFCICLNVNSQVILEPSNNTPNDTNPIFSDTLEIEVVDSTGEEIVDTNIIKNYEVDYRKIVVMGSFLLNENSRGYSSTMEEKAKVSLFFFEGVKLALDSLNKLGLHADVTVLDNTASPDQLGNLFADPSIQKAELILGPIYNPIIRTADMYSKTFKLPMVSPLSPTPNLVSNNPLFVQLNPSLESLQQTILEKCVQLQFNNKIYIVNSNDSEDLKRLATFKSILQAFNTKNKTTLELVSLTYESSWSTILDTLNENVLIVNSFKESFAKQISDKLSTFHPNAKMIIAGLPSWKEFSGMKNLFVNSRILTTVPQYLDANSSTYNTIVRRFKRTNALIPNETIIKGFDVMMYYGLRMLNYGKDFFQKSLTEPYEGIIYKINPVPVYAANGKDINYYENKSSFNIEWDTYSKKWRIVY